MRPLGRLELFHQRICGLGHQRIKESRLVWIVAVKCTLGKTGRLDNSTKRGIFEAFR